MELSLRRPLRKPCPHKSVEFSGSEDRNSALRLPELNGRGPKVCCAYAKSGSADGTDRTRERGAFFVLGAFLGASKNNKNHKRHKIQDLHPLVRFCLWHQIPKTLNRKIQGFFMPAI